MTTRSITQNQKSAALSTSRWVQIGLQAAVAAIVLVLLTQKIILTLWPDLAAFKPLESFPRSALFTLIPALASTAVFAWLVKTQEEPVKKFILISAVVLLVSFIPDYILPVPNKTIAASSAAAFLHLIAGVVTVTLITAGYARFARSAGRN